MKILNKSRGNMYPWVDATCNPLPGCKHGCIYCYLIKGRFKYNMTPRFREAYLNEDLYAEGRGITIFMGSAGDMFGEWVKEEHIYRVLNWCCKYGENTYVFQTKNPSRFRVFREDFPRLAILGTTIETTRPTTFISTAPLPAVRMDAMTSLSYDPNGSNFFYISLPKFVSVEPIIDFHLEKMIDWLFGIGPRFVSIGAASMRPKLPEPSAEKVIELIEALRDAGIEVKLKKNLKRIVDVEFLVLSPQIVEVKNGNPVS